MTFFSQSKTQSGVIDLRSIAISRLRSLEQEAADGRKLSGTADRLKAAWHLRRAWQQANKAGLRKKDFQDRVLGLLKHRHARRESFKLANYLLPRRYETVSDALPHYEANPNLSEPLRGLEPYLKGLEVTATWCEANPEDWKLDLLQETSLWKRNTSGLGVQEPDERPAETLALLCSALCTEIARRHDLARVYDALRRLHCRWEMFDNQLVANEYRLEECDSPISSGSGPTYFEESVPYPSICLLGVPYLVAPTRVRVAPEAALHEIDVAHANSAEYRTGGIGVSALWHPEREFYTFPQDAPGQRQLVAELVYRREIRLCIVPDGHGGFTAALESRPCVELTIPDDDPLAGRHFVHAAWKPDFGEALFYARRFDDGPVLPTIRDADGKAWRVRFDEPDPGAWQVTIRDPETTGWQFDDDPVDAPGLVDGEPWYLSYTPATPAYLAHWLTRDWSLMNASACCPWDRHDGAHGADAERYDQNLPPLHELKFPGGSAATSVECCLHNGLLEEALDVAASRLAAQVSALQRDWTAASDGHVQRLLNRWSKTQKKEA